LSKGVSAIGRPNLGFSKDQTGWLIDPCRLIQGFPLLSILLSMEREVGIVAFLLGGEEAYVVISLLLLFVI